MPNEPPSKPRWSRWAPIVRTSPSGKTLFVCLVCGDMTPSMTNTCPMKDEGAGLHVDPRVGERFGAYRLSCSDIEHLINEERQKRMPEHLVLDWHENKLRAEVSKYCDLCHGYGCQHCLGRGTRW